MGVSEAPGCREESFLVGRLARRPGSRFCAAAALLPPPGEAGRIYRSESGSLRAKRKAHPVPSPNCQIFTRRYCQIFDRR